MSHTPTVNAKNTTFNREEKIFLLYRKKENVEKNHKKKWSEMIMIKDDQQMISLERSSNFYWSWSDHDHLRFFFKDQIRSWSSKKLKSKIMIIILIRWSRNDHDLITLWSPWSWSSEPWLNWKMAVFGFWVKLSI